MDNNDLKKKICEIVAPYVSAYGDDEAIADALIAKGLTFEPIVIRTIEPSTESQKKIHEIYEQNEAIIAEVEHRAEVAEKALEILAHKIALTDLSDMSIIATEKVKQKAIEQAEKELAEEKKNENRT